jgi:hypothetical protein
VVVDCKCGLFQLDWALLSRVVPSIKLCLYENFHKLFMICIAKPYFPGFVCKAISMRYWSLKARLVIKLK